MRIKAKNHFPDWLMYLSVAISIVVVSLFFHLKNSDMDAKSMKELKSKQGKLMIKNNGAYPFQCTKLISTYWDSASNSIKQVLSNSKTEPIDGNAIALLKTLEWDGTGISFFVEVEGLNKNGEAVQGAFQIQSDSVLNYADINLDKAEAFQPKSDEVISDVGTSEIETQGREKAKQIEKIMEKAPPRHSTTKSRRK